MKKCRKRKPKWDKAFGLRKNISLKIAFQLLHCNWKIAFTKLWRFSSANDSLESFLCGASCHRDDRKCQIIFHLGVIQFSHERSLVSLWYLTGTQMKHRSIIDLNENLWLHIERGKKFWARTEPEETKRVRVFMQIAIWFNYVSKQSTAAAWHGMVGIYAHIQMNQYT